MMFIIIDIITSLRGTNRKVPHLTVKYRECPWTSSFEHGRHQLFCELCCSENVTIFKKSIWMNDDLGNKQDISMTSNKLKWP